MLAAAQGRDEYIGPETTYEPDMRGAGKSWRPGSDWEYCATEGDRCRIDGWGLVRYGTAGRYVYREVRNVSFRCDNRQFGDPAPRRKKSCEVRYYGGGGYRPGPGPGPGHGHGHPPGGGYVVWDRCAREGDYCDFRGRRTVRYGVDGRFVEREARGGIECNNRAFGRDPAPGRGKYCEIESR